MNRLTMRCEREPVSHMLHTVSALVAGLLLAGTVRAETAVARPRGGAAPPPLTADEKAARQLQQAANLKAWLPRLVGRFKIEGVVKAENAEEPSSATGKVDCIAIGDGPGVQCVMYATWDEIMVGGFPPTTQTGALSFLGPASILYGVDPNAVSIRIMQLDTDGLVTDGAAQLNGDSMFWRFEGFCPREPQEMCRQDTRVYAPPHARYLHTTIEISPLDENSDGDAMTVDLEMTPIPRDEAGTPPETPGAPARNPG